MGAAIRIATGHTGEQPRLFAETLLVSFKFIWE
jgi:hypothetical protein